MAPEQSSAIGRRRLRSELRQAREAAGFTQEQVTREMEWSLSKLIRIETGAVGVSTNDLKALLHLYGVQDRDRIAELTELARASRRKPAWWAAYRGLLSEQYRKYIEYESAAAIQRYFDPLLIPGILQTEDYARAVVASGGPGKLDDREIERYVEVRRIRQQELRQHGRRQVTALLGEAAVRQVVGGRAVMRQQLTSLLEGEYPGVTVRVLPFRLGAHPGLSGGFTILEFADPADPDLLYVETPQRDLVDSGNAQALHMYLRAFADLEERALSTGDTTALLRDLTEELS
ncbi:MAG: helix-turn-helix domain-containing protein [Micromonosporaceae bacterium]